MAIKQFKYNKYKNIKTYRLLNDDYIYFDSKKEALRYDCLLTLLKTGLISDLTLQPEFIICPEVKYKDYKKMSTMKYIADFKYTQEGKIIVEDVKGYKTKEYKLKRQLFLSQYGNKYDFREI